MGGTENKPYSIQNYTLLMLSYHEIQPDKLKWSTVTAIIKMKWPIAANHNVVKLELLNSLLGRQADLHITLTLYP